LAGILESLRPRNLGEVMTPDVMRVQLLHKLKQQGRTDIDVNRLTPEQMMMMLRTQPVSTTGIRG
jgi:hypothetical protein